MPRLAGLRHRLDHRVVRPATVLVLRLRTRRFVRRELSTIRAMAAAFTVDPAPRPRVYVYWAQGFDSAPPVVQMCVARLRALHGPDLVELDDEDPLAALPVSIPDLTKRSDVLRLALMARHGGVWVDATCLPTSNLLDVSESLLEGDFFAFRRSDDRPVATWFLAARPGAYVARMWLAAHLVFWRAHQRPFGYFLAHRLFAELLRADPEFRNQWSTSHHLDVEAPSALQTALLSPYDPDRLRALTDGCFVHKLTHKTDVPAGSTLEQLLRRSTP